MADLKKWEGAVEIPIDLIEPNDWNPNVQSDATFEALVEEIHTSGFDEPLVVVPHPDKKGAYRIISGEHRWKAAKTLGMQAIPVVVKEQWDEATQKVQTVRRNMLRGELDRVKFSKLVNDVVETYGVARENVPKLMGFTDDKEFVKHYLAEKGNSDAKLREMMAQTKKETQMVDNLSFLLNEIFSKFGSTLSQGFIFFFYKGRMHLMVQMDKDLEDQVSLMVEMLKGSGQNVNDFLGKAIGRELNGITPPISSEPKSSVEY
jgi:ParB/RepB/Spo0J family partition protein